jgi:hypothetical protein
MWDKVIRSQCLIWEETYLIYSYLRSCWHRIRIDTLKENRGVLVGMSDRGHRNSDVVCVKYKLFATLSCLVFTGYHTWNSALVIQHAKTHAPYYISICDLSGSNICFHIISQTTRSWGGGYWRQKCVFWFSLQLLSEKFLILWRI